MDNNMSISLKNITVLKYFNSWIAYIFVLGKVILNRALTHHLKHKLLINIVFVVIR